MLGATKHTILIQNPVVNGTQNKRKNGKINITVLFSPEVFLPFLSSIPEEVLFINFTIPKLPLIHVPGKDVRGIELIHGDKDYKTGYPG